MSYTCAIIVAGGDGIRMDSDVPKQYMNIGSRSVLWYTVHAFDLCEAIDKIIVVSRKDYVEKTKAMLSDIKKLDSVVGGGKNRAESVVAGLNSVTPETEYVAIHDAARCLITCEMITEVVAFAKKTGAATASSSVCDTVKTIDFQENITSTLDRSKIRLAQTPQVFRIDLYKNALFNADLASVTDDNMLLERMGVKVHMVDTGKENIKITEKSDLGYAEYLLKKRGDLYV